MLARFCERGDGQRAGSGGVGGEQWAAGDNPFDQKLEPPFLVSGEEQHGGALAAIDHKSIAATDAAVGRATSGPAAQTAAAESAPRVGTA
eukprot:4572400-Prymnesium_polylepis.1